MAVRTRIPEQASISCGFHEQRDHHLIIEGGIAQEERYKYATFRYEASDCCRRTQRNYSTSSRVKQPQPSLSWPTNHRLPRPEADNLLKARLVSFHEIFSGFCIFAYYFLSISFLLLEVMMLCFAKTTQVRTLCLCVEDRILR
jgi:hypothetical protein